MAASVTATLRRTDNTSGYMRPGGARRALLTFLQYDNSPTGARATTLRLVCFPACALRDLRPLLAPFGLSLRPDGSGFGDTPAGPVLCAAAALGGPRPVLTLWKTAAVERAMLAGVLKERNGALGVLPVAVFREVLWPWVRLAARSTGELGKAVPDELYLRQSPRAALSLSDSSEGVLPNEGEHEQMHLDGGLSDSDTSSSSLDDDLEELSSDDENVPYFDLDDSDDSDDDDSDVFDDSEDDF